jgi:hypothetical protein
LGSTGETEFKASFAEIYFAFINFAAFNEIYFVYTVAGVNSFDIIKPNNTKIQ